MVKGSHHTSEANEKNRLAHLGRPGNVLSDEVCERISQKLMGHPVSDETRRKWASSQRRESISERRKVQWHGVKKFEYRIVWEEAHGPLPKGWVIHHIDGDFHNNELSNLDAMPLTEHSSLHARLRHG